MVVGLPLLYAFKRVARSWKLFAALLLGVVLASTFFAGINIGADTVAAQALEQRLSNVPVDIVVRSAGGEVRPFAMETLMWSSANATEVANFISGSGIVGIVGTEVISMDGWDFRVGDTNKTEYFRVAGISDNSCIYEGLTVTSGSFPLGLNETYVLADSPSAGDLQVGDVLYANFSLWLGEEPKIPLEVNWISLNLTVAGFVELDSKASRIASGYYYYYGDEYIYVQNLLITDWKNTFAKLLDSMYAMSPPYSPTNTEILVFLDRGTIIGPWDIATSTDKVRTITSQINNKLWSEGYNGYAENHLEYVLREFQSYSQYLRLQFLLTALPVFFMAWYMGSTVSDMSLNLRRREIGLLLTKGFSTGQLLRMFLSEAILIGLIGGFIGVGLSLLMSPFFVSAGGGQWFSGVPIVGIETAILTVILGIVITFLSVYRPAKRASQLHAVDALREYRYVEEVKPHKQRWPWVAFILGTYKIIMWILGINLLALTWGAPPTTNVVIMILLGIWIFFDGYVLNYLGPILLFWGLTRLLIRGSLKFQELTTKIVKFLGDLGSLATRNVQRNPARAASIAFLIALIIWYSFQVTGTYASERDFAIRQIRFNVGADVSVSLTTLVNSSDAVNQIENLTGVSYTVLEYSFEGGSSLRWMSLVAVNPEKWLETAYYESELFSGNSVETAFYEMAADNNTIILEREIAASLGLRVSDTIFVTAGSVSRTLRVVGFFGLEPIGSAEILEGVSYSSVSYASHSYVPDELYHKAKDNVSATGRILVKLASGADGKAVADQIRKFETSNIGLVSSVAEELEVWRSDVEVGGRLNVQLLGVAFAVVAASIGTALVTLVSLRERSKEVSIMSIRGVSFKQLVAMLLTENIAVVVFSVLIGTTVGLISVYGNVVFANTMPYSSSILSHHMVFPTDVLLILLACLTLVFASTIIPVIIMSQRYVSRLERIVKEA